MPKFSSLYFLFFFLLAAPPLFARQQALTNGDIDKNIAESNAFFNRVEDLSSYQRVVNLATQIINNRQKYDNTTIAISFSLLADAAIYEGDSDSAFQFAQDGLKQGRIDRVVQLKLFTRLAAGFYAKGNYNSVLKTSTQSIFLAQDKKYLPYLLESYGYRAIANALLGHYQQAYVDLQTIDQLLDKNPQQANQLELLRILAVANLNLGDYKTSVTLHLKLLKLQFSLARKENIERTYYNLATAYLKLERYDDAYNAFWEVKKLSEKKLAPILLAYAQLGLGEVLLQQGENELAYASLIKAEKLFKGKNLNKAYLSNLIALAKVSQNTNRELFASQLLQKAERLAQRTGLTRDQIVLYKMLSSNYKKQDNYRKALRMLNKFLQLSELFKRSRVEKAELQVKAKLTTDKSRKLLLKLSEKSTLFTEFSNKNHRLLQYLCGVCL